MPASASSKAPSADDTTSLRHQQPELYLQPITRPVPTLDEAKEADASYRRLRDQWHKHMALAETSELHPYEIQGYAPLIDAMRELRDRPHLDATARNALDAVLDQHLRIQQARADIDRLPHDTAHAFRSLPEPQGHRRTVQRPGRPT